MVLKKVLLTLHLLVHHFLQCVQSVPHLLDLLPVQTLQKLSRLFHFFEVHLPRYSLNYRRQSDRFCPLQLVYFIYDFLRWFSLLLRQDVWSHNPVAKLQLRSSILFCILGQVGKIRMRQAVYRLKDVSVVKFEWFTAKVNQGLYRFLFHDLSADYTIRTEFKKKIL